MITRILASFLAFATLTTGAVVAEEIDDDRDSPIVIEGTISEATAAEVEAQLRKIRHGRPIIVVEDSPGGDAYAGMRIGHMLRVTKARIRVETACDSACSLIYFGAVSRSLKGTLGLHRPYIFQESGGSNPTQDEMLAIYSDITNYARYMNIPEATIQVMMATSPETMSEYTKESIREVVPTVDPAYEEWSLANQASLYKLDTATVRDRLQIARDAIEENCYYEGSDVRKCASDVRESILWNVSISDFLSRKELGKVSCVRTPKDEEAFDDLRNAAINDALDQMSDLPLVKFNQSEPLEEQRKCWQRVMRAENQN